jgi:hypothetical protein
MLLLARSILSQSGRTYISWSLYRYFDCTEAAEFLYGCVARAVNEDLPHEIDFLRRNDEAKRRIMNSSKDFRM